MRGLDARFQGVGGRGSEAARCCTASFRRLCNLEPPAPLLAAQVFDFVFAASRAPRRFRVEVGRQGFS